MISDDERGENKKEHALEMDEFEGHKLVEDGTLNFQRYGFFRFQSDFIV